MRRHRQIRWSHREEDLRMREVYHAEQEKNKHDT